MQNKNNPVYTNKNIITIATGKAIYMDMAVNLAKSFLWWHQKSEINFSIITDQPGSVPSDIHAKIKIIEVNPGELGKGFSSKLHLDKLAPMGQTLFIDSDCLIFGDLNFVFDRFKGKAVSVVGHYVEAGEWFGDVKKICENYQIPHFPKFNGGIYYIEKGELAIQVYKTARELEKKYDQIGFVRLRGLPNDEVIMALAMQIHHQTPIIDDGTIMSDPQACPGKYKIDVIEGKKTLTNPPFPNPLHRHWYPFEKVEPVIVHFLGSYTQHYPYKREVFRLKKAVKNNLHAGTESFAKFFIEYPERIKIGFKNKFRPLFHYLFGTRNVPKSDRII